MTLYEFDPPADRDDRFPLIVALVALLVCIWWRSQ
jgi:hypothetical protein